MSDDGRAVSTHQSSPLRSSLRPSSSTSWGGVLLPASRDSARSVSRRGGSAPAAYYALGLARVVVCSWSVVHQVSRLAKCTQEARPCIDVERGASRRRRLDVVAFPPWFSLFLKCHSHSIMF